MNFKRYNESDNSWTDSHYIKKTDTDTITTLPAIIYPLAQTASLGLKGNTTQNGTPTPQNPIQPQGTGERTGNLFDITAATSGKYVRDTDGSLRNSDDTYASDYIDVSNITTLYPQYFTDVSPVKQWAAFYDSSKTFISGFSGYNRAITVPNDAVYVRLTVDNNYVSNFTVSSSELERYEPYGQYKIPISINNVVTDIYIGDNPLRKSLDGTAYDTLAADGTLTRRVDSDGSVLPTPIITQVTMPTFTTTPGANTLNVLTTVQPSEVTATFDGWHPVSSVHERSGGSWT